MRSPLVAAHQPNFLPWFGYFEKMLKCDIFVHSDDVRYPKQTYTNRVEMVIGERPHYVTLPVVKGNDGRLADKDFVRDEEIYAKVMKTLQLNLSRYRHFCDIEPVLEEFARAYWQCTTIADLNIQINQHIARMMGISTPTLRGTDLGLGAYRRNERLVARCRALKSDSYLCGQGADAYQDEAFLAASGVRLRRIDYAVGQALFGEDLRFTVVQGIAKYGLVKVRDAVAKYRDGK